MAAAIDVRKVDAGDPATFEVLVREPGSESRHDVTMTRATFVSLTGESVSEERFLEAAFRFLLDREPKESILSRFDVTVISRYFPGFPREITGYLGR